MSKKKVDILGKIPLSEGWYNYSKYSYRHLLSDNKFSENISREVLDKGDGAAVLLFSFAKRTVVLVKQFRLPVYLNSATREHLIEVCAGTLDGMSPEECIKKEITEETGFSLHQVQPVMVIYMSPGAVTEKNHLFIADYTEAELISAGGGLACEGEHIEVLEMPFEHAYSMIETGEIVDAKTVILLQYAKQNIFNDF